jgi:hypothetical protein
VKALCSLTWWEPSYGEREREAEREREREKERERERSMRR